MQLIAKTLEYFCTVSGMKVNLKKSRMFCSKTVDQETQQVLYDVLGIGRASDLGNYLGLPILKGRVTKENFSPIIAKVNTRLASWKNKLLNKRACCVWLNQCYLLSLFMLCKLSGYLK